MLIIVFRFSFPSPLQKVIYLRAYTCILDPVVLNEVFYAEDSTLFSDSKGMYFFISTEYQAAILHLKREHKEEIETLKV